MVDRRTEETRDDEAPPSHRVLVPFDGDGDGVGAGPLTWAQQQLWQIMQAKHTWLPIGTLLPLPAGTTIDDAVADLRFVMESYPSMRTRVRLDADGPKQVVSAAGEIALEVVDVPDGADPAEVARQTRRRIWNGPHDVFHEWPLRMAVIRHRGVLTHRVWVMCHLVTDGGGARVIVQEMATRDPSGSRAAHSPLALARRQRSPAGDRQSASALRYWEKALRQIPARLPGRQEAAQPYFWQGSAGSPALDLAVRAIADRTRTEEPSVLLAIFALSLVRITGVNPVVTQVVVGNRFRPGLARTVSPIIQNGLFVLTVPDATVDETVAAARRQAMVAYKNAYYDPIRWQELVDRITRDRGEEVDIGVFVNDRRLKPRNRHRPVPTPEQIRAAAGQSSFRWTHKQDEIQFDKLYLNIDDEPDTMAMTVLCDTRYLSPDEVEACVRGMEDVAVAAALDPTVRTPHPAAGAVP
jgi:hypothetical protein